MTDTGVDTRLVPIKGREIVVKQLTDAQLVLMGRDASMLERTELDDRRKLRAAGDIMDMFESAIVQQVDRDYVFSLVRKGELELKDFLEFLTAFAPEPEVKKPAVRRGRPPRKAQ